MTILTAQVSRILAFSCVDGPGNRLVLFLQGCNVDCRSCHNPHTINQCNHCGDCVPHCSSNALTINDNHKVVWQPELCTQCDNCIEACVHKSNPKINHYSVEDVLAIIRKQHFFLSGITVSGGEATIQLPFIIELFKAIKADAELAHLSCFIDSNGYLSTKAWDRVAPYLDGTMIDLKAWHTDTHRWLVGRDNHRIIASIGHLAALGKLYEVRLLHIPDHSDLLTEVNAISRLLNELPNSVQIRLNAFQNHSVVGEAKQWQICRKHHIIELQQQLAAQIQQSIILPSIMVD